MGAEEFLDLFIRELEDNGDLRQYYRLINDKSRFYWRKAYLHQRLKFIAKNISGNRQKIWDAGCGYATTAIFLALNGHQVTGNTLEFYFDKIDSRLKYWSKYGDLSGLNIRYANLFDMVIPPAEHDIIITQDTLHHLEPIDDALKIFHAALKPAGKLLVSEENGEGIFIRAKNFITRGNNRISYYYDEKLKKSIPFGNENARSLKEWIALFDFHGLTIDTDHAEYIRRTFPFHYNRLNYDKMLDHDKIPAFSIGNLNRWLYFGINFTATKNNSMTDNSNPVPVEVFAGTQWEAALVKSLLENAEIESFLKDEIRGTTMPWQVTPAGICAVKVVVSSNDLTLAKQVVEQFQAGRNAENN